MGGEVGADGILLVVGGEEDVGETTAGGELVGSGLGIANLGALGEGGGTDSGGVGARGSSVGSEDVLVGAEARSATAGNTVVTGGDDDGGSLETELHELLALALEVGVGVRGLVPSVGDGEDVGGLEGTAVLVGGGTVNRGIVTTLELAEGTVNGIQEGVEDVVLLDNGLVESNSLGIDNGDGNVQVEGDLTTSAVGGVVGSAGTVDQVGGRGSASGDLGGNSLVEGIQIRVEVSLVGGLEDTEEVAWVSSIGGLGDVVHGLDAVGGDLGVTAVGAGVGEVVRHGAELVGSDGVLVASLDTLGGLLGLEDGGRGDEVDNLGDVAGEVVLVGTNVLVAGLNVAVGVVLGLEEVLKLGSGHIGLDPLVGLGDSDVAGGDALILEPLDDLGDGLGIRGEHVGNLLLGQVLSVLGRIGVRAEDTHVSKIDL